MKLNTLKNHFGMKLNTLKNLFGTNLADKSSLSCSYARSAPQTACECRKSALTRDTDPSRQRPCVHLCKQILRRKIILNTNFTLIKLQVTAKNDTTNPYRSCVRRRRFSYRRTAIWNPSPSLPCLAGNRIQLFAIRVYSKSTGFLIRALLKKITATVGLDLRLRSTESSRFSSTVQLPPWCRYRAVALRRW